MKVQTIKIQVSKIQTVVRRTFSSVVAMMVPALILRLARAPVPVFLSCFLIASCTARHTAATSAQVMSDLGLRSAVTVTRSSFWSLPDNTAIYLGAPELSPGLQHNFPRLRLELNRALEAVVEEQFPGYQRADGDADLSTVLSDAAVRRCDVVLRLSLNEVEDRLSSFAEVSEHYGLSDASAGRDHLRLVLRVYDVGTGRLLDNLSVSSRSGWWRWREHKVADLLEPALAAMVGQLRGHQLARQD